MKKEKQNEEKNIEKNEHDMKVVIGDESILEISEVGDYMGDLKPKDFKSTKKQVIIPTEKNKNKKKKND